MFTSEKILKTVIYISLVVIVFYSLKCIIPRIKIKENLTQYCEPIFTAPGTEISISTLGVQKYLSIDKNSSKDNVILSSIAMNKWELERVVDRNSVEGKGNEKGFYHDFSKPDRCSVYIKTKSMYKTKDDKPTFLQYYLTRNNIENFIAGFGENYVSASLFGKCTKQVWYVIDLANLPEDGAYSDIVTIGKPLGSNNTRYVFIVTDPTAFKTNKKDSKTYFLTANIGKTDNKYSFNSLTLKIEPTEHSIWQLNLEKKGDIVPLQYYKPTLSIDEFPNNDNKSFSSFMNTYLPIWNRTWYSNDNTETKSFKVQLCSPVYEIKNGQYSLKDTFATGKVIFDNKYTDSLNKAIFDVKSQGSDVLIGEQENPKNPDDKLKIILRMLPQNSVPLGGKSLPGGVPVLHAWVVKPAKGGKIETTSICALNDKNFAGVCMSTNKPSGFQQYLIKKDFLPVDSETNFNLTKVENFQDWKNTVNYKNTECSAPVGNLSRCIY